MIPVQRVAAPAEAHRLLVRRTANVLTRGATTEAARGEWGRAHAARRRIRGLLAGMASGIQRCMYCEDSLGTDIDHFEPIAEAPLRAFEWPNHLLACSHCNSNHKRDAFPRAPDGSALLVDPSSEDPADHLTLLLNSGTYQASTAKGRATVEVFGLNRPDLVLGRQAAFHMAQGALQLWHGRIQGGDAQGASAIEDALVRTPFAVVLRTMLRLPAHAAAVVVDDPRTVGALAAWREAHPNGGTD